MINLTNLWQWINKYNPEISKLNTKLTILQNELTSLQSVTDKILKAQETEIDKYCKANFKTIPPIAYKQKREIKDKSYTVALQELITPDAYEVHKLMKGVDRDSGTILDIAKRIGNKVAGYLVWDSDNNLSTSGDYYLMPSEAIARKFCDCEDHAGVVSSCHLEIGMAWGFYGNDGHCFNVFCMEGVLYILDTVEDIAIIKRYNGQDKYQIHYIVTRKGYYEVKGGVQFGTLAGWD